jgi:hypothetical protein
MNALHPAAATPLMFEFVDRCDTAMPADYLPSAPGVMFANEDVLSGAGYVSGSIRPKGWHKHQPGNYRKRVGNHVLLVRQCRDARCAHWTIERYGFWEFKWVEALVFPFGHVPIWARTRQAAMRLAEHCCPVPCLPVAGRWEVAR